MRRPMAIAALLVLDLASCSTNSEPTATYTGGACDYDGPSEFDLDSTVTFTVINESDTTEAGFALWKFPDDATPEAIFEQGIFEFVDLANSSTVNRPSLGSQIRCECSSMNRGSGESTATTFRTATSMSRSKTT